MVQWKEKIVYYKVSNLWAKSSKMAIVRRNLSRNIILDNTIKNLLFYYEFEIIAFILSSRLRNSLDPRIITMTDQGHPQDCDPFSRL